MSAASPGSSPGGVWADLERRARVPAPEGDGLWEALRREADPTAFRPRLAGDVEIREFQLRWGNDYAIIANPRDLLHYRLDPKELELVRLMDGTRTVKELVVERFRASGDLELAAVADLVRQLHEGGFLDQPYVDVAGAVTRALQPGGFQRRMGRFLRTLSIEWAGAHGLVRWLYDHGLRIFFRPAAVVGGGLVSVAGIVAFVMLVRSGRIPLHGDSLAVEALIILALNYVLTFLHELGHALVIVHHGRKVKSAGFMVYFGSPAFFVDASDALMLDRRARITQAFAGPFAEAVVAGIAAMIALAFPDTLASSILYKFAVLNYFVLFLNLVPLLELDGYFILSDVIQVPELRPLSLSFLRHDLWRKVINRERWAAREVGLFLYGVLGTLFALFSFYTGYFFWRSVFGSLISRMWNGGPVTRLLLFVLALLVAGPLVRGAIELLRTLTDRVRTQWRRLRFRLQQRWRIEAAELIEELPLFGGIPVETLNELAGRIRLRAYDAGVPVVRQGERAEAFYVVRRGALAVVEEDPAAGSERVLRTLGRGDAFGEMGLLDAAPRAATVRTVTATEVFEVDKGTFDQLLADMATAPDLAPTIASAAELASLPSFSHLQPDELGELLEHGQWVNLAPGSAVVTQGERGEHFFAIRSGQVEVREDGRAVGTLGPGDYFGEIALLLDVPRMATVVARTPVRAFRLHRRGFDHLVRDAFRRGSLRPHAVVARTGLH